MSGNGGRQRKFDPTLRQWFAIAVGAALVVVVLIAIIWPFGGGEAATSDPAPTEAATPTEQPTESAGDAGDEPPILSAGQQLRFGTVSPGTYADFLDRCLDLALGNQELAEKRQALESGKFDQSALEIEIDRLVESRLTTIKEYNVGVRSYYAQFGVWDERLPLYVHLGTDVDDCLPPPPN